MSPSGQDIKALIINNIYIILLPFVPISRTFLLLWMVSVVISDLIDSRCVVFI